MRSRMLRLACAPLLALAMLPAIFPAQEEPLLTPEQQREFLLSAKVIRSEKLSVGVTQSHRLTLSDGNITHNAHFQSINERRSYKELDRGGEINFVDSYHYNIAAYELAKLIGLDAMVPVTVERSWDGKRGAIAWWFPTQTTEGKRRERRSRRPM